MEAVIAEPPAGEVAEHFVLEVEVRPGRVVVIVHWAPFREPEVGSLKGIYNNMADVSRELLDCRRILLMKFLQQSLDRSPNVSSAVHLAFERTNPRLGTIAGKGLAHWQEGFWRAQNTSLVVVVQHEHVHVFGCSPGVALLCRNNEDKHLVRPPLPSLAAEDKLRNTRTRFGYYHKEKLTKEDTHLVVGTRHTIAHCAGSFAEILKSRIKAFGLAEACKQVAGRYAGYPRTFACVSLGDVESFRGGVEEPEPAAYWGIIGPAEEKAPEKAGEKAVEKSEEKAEVKAKETAEEKAPEKAEQKPPEKAEQKPPEKAGEKAMEENPEKAEEKAEDAGEDEDCEEDDGIDPEYWVKVEQAPSLATHLFPLRDGKPQKPSPRTSFMTALARAPCIRKFDFQNYEEPAMSCDYNCCSIIIRRGYLNEWRVDGKTDAIVNVMRTAASSSSGFEGLQDFGSTSQSRLLVSRVIHVEAPERENLAEAYKKLLSRAFKRRVRHLGIPAFFSKRIDFAHLDRRLLYKEAAEIIRVVIEVVGKVSVGLKDEKKRQRIQVHFVLDEIEVWRAFVAATDLLAHWEGSDRRRWYKLAGLYK